MPPRPSPSSASITLTDEALVAFARAGEAAGLGGLYDRYATRMLRVACRLTGSSADAEDIVHDVFVALPAKLRRYEHRGSLEAWLAQVTARAALMRIRSGQRRREEELSEAITVQPAATAEYADLERQIDAKKR